MRVLTFLALFLSFSFLATAQDNSDKTLVKTLDPQEASSLVVNFKATEINPEPWDGQGFRIELVISANMPLQVLEQLVKAGRYTLEGVKEGEQYFVTAPNMEKAVTVRGKDLEEKITVHIKTPGYYALTDKTLAKDANTFAARIDGTDAEAAALKEFMKIKDKVAITNVVIQSTLKGNPDLKLKTGDLLIGGVPVEIAE